MRRFLCLVVVSALACPILLSGCDCAGNVSTSNRPPVANAGGDLQSDVGATALLDGSQSNDPDGDELTFAWELVESPAGAQATLSGADTVHAELVPDARGTWRVQLIVNDGIFSSEPDEAIITVGTTCETDADCTNDDLWCNGHSGCVDGECVFEEANCDDGDVCTQDLCNEDLDRCDYPPITDPPGPEGPVGDPSCSDGLDNDCDGLTDDLDPACIVCSQDDECDDLNACTDDRCQADRCVNSPVPAGEACYDGFFCTGDDVCDDTGRCVGVDKDCAEVADACNRGTCDEVADRCVPVPLDDGSACDDAQWCTENDTCVDGLCQGASRDCSAESGVCVVGVCNEIADRCEGQPAADGTICDDGFFCTANEKCTGGACGGGEPRDCTASGGGCVDGLCDETSDACVGDPLPSGTSCSDDQFCTVNDACDGAGSCQGTARDCSALTNQCNQGSCDEVFDTCVADPANEGQGCDDGLFCTQGETCLTGSCVNALPRDCDDSDVCTLDACDEANDQCAYQLVPNPGAEGLAMDGTCTDGLDNDCDLAADNADPDCQQCQIDDDCNDFNPCTVNTCDSNHACQTQVLPDTTPCDDELFCTVSDECQAGACTGAARDCSMLDSQCRQGVCDEGAAICISQPINEGNVCDDALFCTVGETCQSGFCVGSQPRDCSALTDQCNQGACDDDADLCVAVASNEGQPCDDGLFCNAGEVCLAGGCAGGAPRDCSAATDDCNDGVCDEGGDVCQSSPKPDGTECGARSCNGLIWLRQTCLTGGCSGTEVMADCADSLVCTTDMCVPATGCDNADLPAGQDCGNCAACDGGGSCVSDLSQDVDCPLCQECAAIDTCVDQGAGADVKDECTGDACNTGSCDGNGACGVRTAGIDCGTCAACDGSGACVDDLSQDGDCPACQECTTGATCTPQSAGDDIKDDCASTACATGNCDGSGACEVDAVGTSCGICRACDSFGSCLEDLGLDTDCPLCQECALGGGCEFQSAGDDEKDECISDNCNTGVCDGAGACGVTTAGTDCGTCSACDGAGGCVDDLSQDGDCGQCEECSPAASCANQPDGSDVKGECIDLDYCNGLETCDGNGACQPGSDPCAPLVCDEVGNQCLGCLTDADCPECQECDGTNNCVMQAPGTDAKDECNPDACNTGVCDGAGACGVETAGTDCGQCLTCDGAGACVDDLAEDTDCPLCQECAPSGQCADQAAGSDVKTECSADACNTGTCDGNGACGFQPATTDCGVCQACDGAGSCVDDLAQDTDCLVCQECTAGGTCSPQAAGDDAKDECAPGACASGDCDGAGACEVTNAGTDCGQCRTCDGAGVCVDDLDEDADCPFCQECAPGGNCTDQAAGSDAKDECASGTCVTGACDGSGACGFDTAGTDCGQCQSCDGGGLCVDDLSQDADCPLCQSCGAGGACVDQAAGSDVKDECTADACNTGDCDGGGACGFLPATTDCGLCQACDGAGTCADDLDQDAECPLCEECGAGGGCVPQASGDDLKEECSADACNTGDCDGASACGLENPGTDCGICASCDGAGTCVDNLNQDNDCPLCEECAPGRTCVEQAAGDDTKDECPADACRTGVCDGFSACEVELPGTDCGTCLACDGTGGCVDDLSQDDDCTLCRQCGVSGSCVPQPAGSDSKDECTADTCNTGDCDGASACGFFGVGTDCGVCLSCDGLGVCLDDLGDDIDCPQCEECDTGGTCVDQAAGDDVKGECADPLYCNGVETCDGAGACQSGTDPCTPLVCDEGNDQCVGCLGNNDCPLCQECVATNCEDQPAGSDVKNDCPPVECHTGDCDGSGACEFDAFGSGCPGDDLDYCNSSCDGTGTCDDGTPVNCSDGEACTIDTCNTGNGNCSYADRPNGSPCDGSDSEPCNSSCQGGTCDDLTNATAGQTCDDGYDCTGTDTCDGLGNCDGTEDDSYCDDQFAGDLCRPQCFDPPSGCGTPPSSATLQCLPNPVDLGVTDTATCDLDLGRTGQTDCIYCYPEVGMTILDFSDFANTAGNCSPDGWQLVSGADCSSNVNGCSPNGGRDCCDDFDEICTESTFPDPVLRSVENYNCPGDEEGWKLYKTFDASHLTDLEVCFEIAEQGAGSDEGFFVYAEDGSNGPDQVFCLNGEPHPGTANIFYPYCVSLPAWANGSSDLTVTFMLHSDDDWDFLYLDNIGIRGWYQGCSPTTTTLHTETFAGCSDPIPNGWHGWTIASSDPSNFPECPATNCDNLSVNPGAGVDDGDWMQLQRRIDATSLDGDLRLCFIYGDDDSDGSNTQIDVWFDPGSGWRNVWSQGPDFGPNSDCREVCVNLSDADPAVNRNPSLGIRFRLEGDNGPVMLYQMSLSGAEYCDGAAIGAVTLGAYADNGDGTYSFDAVDDPAEQLTSDILCSWDTPPAGEEVEASDSVWYQP